MGQGNGLGNVADRTGLERAKQRGWRRAAYRAALVTCFALALFFIGKHGYNARGEDHGNEGKGEKKIMHISASVVTIGNNVSLMKEEQKIRRS